MSRYNLRTISDNLARVDRDLAQNIAWHTEQAKRTKARIEENYQAAALLDGAGIPLDLSSYSRMEYVTIKLGRRTEKQRARLLRTIRELLECPLRFGGKDVAEGKGQWVVVRLEPRDYSGITITYEQKIPRKANVKCRIVTTKTTTRRLVCEA